MILTRVEKEKSVDCLFDSSNIIASSYNNESRDLTITFKRGAQYVYKNVNARDYLRFETADSQGKVLNTHIKSYEYSKLPDVNTEILINEINIAKEKGMSEEETTLLENMGKFIEYHENKSEINLELLDRLDAMIKGFLEIVTPEDNE
jgi:hypothetical protein